MPPFSIFDVRRAGGGLCLIQSARGDARLALPPVWDTHKAAVRYRNWLFFDQISGPYYQ
jgi:hypothetical protein